MPCDEFNTTLTAFQDMRVIWDFLNQMDMSDVEDADRILFTQTLTNGTGNNQADEVWYTRSTLAPGGTDTWDVHTPGTQENAFGRGIAFSNMRFWHVRNLGVLTDGVYVPTANHNINIGSGTNPFDDWIDNDSTGQVFVPSGGVFFISCPSVNPFTFGATDINIQIQAPGANSSNVTYDLVLIGVKQVIA